MTDMRTKKLHMIFDMAEQEFTVFVASPYNLFIEPYRSKVETALTFFGLTELVDHKRYATSDEVNKHFPHVEIGPLYILKATMERLPPGGLGQLVSEVAQLTGLPNHALKVWSDDITDEPEEKSKEALLSHGMGEHPDEKILTADQAASLHGSKRIAAVMAELARTDEEKYGNYATTTFAASSTALKEMFNKPFRKGVYECKAVAGEIIVGQKLEEATDVKYLRTKEEVEAVLADTKHRTVLENVDYLTEAADQVKKRVYAVIEKSGMPVRKIEVQTDVRTVEIQFSSASLSMIAFRKMTDMLAAAGIMAEDGSIGTANDRLFYSFDY